MKNRYTLAGLLITTTLLFNGCTKTGPQGPQGTQGNAGPSLTGSITGHFILYDQYGSVQSVSKAGASVVLYNANNQVLDSINPDTAGLYTINNVSTGIYTLAFSDTNYGQELHQDLEFTGGGTLNVDGKMSVIPNFNITGITADSVNHTAQVIIISCTVTSDTRQRTLLTFVGTTASVSSNPANYLVAVPQNIKANQTTVTIVIPLGTLYSAGFSSGSTAYFAIYGAAGNYNNSSSYEDYVTTRTIYNAITATGYSPLPSLVLP